ERGFEHAGLYDPQGVGGTHVMYVLHHADKPSLYHGLPDNPSISPMVKLWKGIAKPLEVARRVLVFGEPHDRPRMLGQVGRVVVHADVGADFVAQVVPLHAC
ncbi:formate dehydrogenase N subunit beta transmembrane domain-containing protein, partial [Burkholderia cenocepacia]|nr:formate dehydrogenase N subunit beta transmembrane domain-containing protein [Burkholderia cenocepacia]